MKVQWT